MAASRRRVVRHVMWALLGCAVLLSAWIVWSLGTLARYWRGTPEVLADGRTLMVVTKTSLRGAYWSLTYRARRDFPDETAARAEVVDLWKILHLEADSFGATSATVVVAGQKPRLRMVGVLPAIALDSYRVEFERRETGGWIEVPGNPHTGLFAFPSYVSTMR